MKEADWYEGLPGGRVHCLLCPQECVINPGCRGFCRARSNHQGKLIPDTYQHILACNLDPVEKKPLYHFHPGSSILSVGTRGCNQRCEFCQNWEMVETDAAGTFITSDEIAAMASRGGSAGVAYTYNEPFTWFEFVLECSRKVRARGKKNVLVTNGFVNPGPLEEVLPWIDAMNIDIKSMDPAFYRRICLSRLEPVLETCRRVSGRCHLEITNLLIPGLNDSDSLIGELVEFVAGLGRETPLHFSAYYPCHRMTLPPTPVETLERARRIAARRLDYVYLGNASTCEGGTTRCPECGQQVVERDGFITRFTGASVEQCSNCGGRLPFVV